MVNANEFYDELKKVDSRNRIFSVSFYGENLRESLYSTMNLKKAAIYYSENYDKVDHFTINFSSNPYGGCNFVTLSNLDELINYNMGTNTLREDAVKKQKITINENQLKQIVLESVKRIIKESVNESLNVTRIRITWLADMGRNKEMIMNNLLKLRKARNVGDEETVNNTVLSALRRYPSYIQFEVIG